MQRESLYLALLVLAALFSTPSSFRFKDLFKRKDVEGVDLTITDGYGKASAVDPGGAALAVAEGKAAVNGPVGTATGKGSGIANGDTSNGNLTAFATSTIKKYKVLGLNLGYGRVEGGFKGNVKGSSSSSSSEEELKESKTMFSIGFDWKNNSKTITKVLPFK